MFESKPQAAHQHGPSRRHGQWGKWFYWIVSLLVLIWCLSMIMLWSSVAYVSRGSFEPGTPKWGLFVFQLLAPIIVTVGSSLELWFMLKERLPILWFIVTPLIWSGFWCIFFVPYANCNQLESYGFCLQSGWDKYNDSQDLAITNLRFILIFILWVAYSLVWYCSVGLYFARRYQAKKGVTTEQRKESDAEAAV